MNRETSKSGLQSKTKKNGLSLDNRVKDFIYRQHERDKSSETSREKTFSYSPLPQPTGALISTTIKSSKSNLKDLKKFKDILRSQLNNKSSYTTCSVLKKVTKKCEEVEQSVKTIESRTKELRSLEKNIENKLSGISSVKDFRNTLNAQSLNSTFSTLQFNKSTPDMELVKRKIIFEEDEIEADEIGTPEFLNHKSSVFPRTIKPTFSSTCLSESKNFSSKNLKTLKSSDCTQTEFYRKKLLEKKAKIKTLESNLICTSILNSVITEAQDKILTKEKNNLKFLQEKLKAELQDISIYQNTILNHHSQRSQEIDIKEKELKRKESQILYQLKLLAQGKSEKLIQFKIEEFEKKEAKMREKHLRLLELKEFLNDKEEELVQREAFLRVRYSSVYKEIDGDEGFGRISEESWNQGFWKRNSEIGELYKSVCEKDNDIMSKALGLKLTD